MRTLSVLIVDDEALARARLKTLLADCDAPAARVVGEAANTVQAVEFLQHHIVDAVLADIHMPGADGLTLAQTLRSLPQAPAIVFVTAFAEHAVQAFELEALDYLTKPVRLQRLQLTLQKVERLMQSTKASEPDLSEDILVIQDRGRIERVPLAQVLYLKAELKYITVRTQNRSFILGDHWPSWRPSLLTGSFASTATPWWPGVPCVRWKSTTTPKKPKAGRCD